MPLVSGGLGTILVAAAAVGALLAWLLRERHYPGPRLVGGKPRIDREALERAEQEVRAAAPPPDAA
ncbi:MAG TPA: hypothetical protein VFW66_00855 [Gemmatimonadales bacterium]|nr:hypothetical protein [Gemmatimonadales bacterium]